MGRYTAGGVGRDLVAGALAGVIAVWVVDKLDWSLYRSGGRQRIRETEAARPAGMDPAHALAAKAAEAVGADIGDPRDNPAGHAMHYVLAAGMGALYGLLRGINPVFATGRGALYGLAMFILKDEVANTVMGTGGNPLDYPVQDHARGAAAHVLFGVVTDLGTRLLAPWRDEVVIYQGPPLSERIEHGRQYLLEHGRPYVEQGRQYLEQGRQVLEQARGQVGQQGREYAKAGRQITEQARRAAAQAAEQARARVSEVDTRDLARAGRRLARRYT
ncbi:MAG TPA: hypothetical protein VE650_14615 [Acetobacteraceae bacterium]|nr:hypothetical protein [Acetobacteraceae bacterium]